MPTPDKPASPSPFRWRPSLWFVIASALILIWSIHAAVGRRTAPKDVAYSDLAGYVRDGKVAAADIDPTTVTLTLKPKEGASADAQPERVRAERLPGIEDRAFVENLSKQGVRVVGRSDRPGVAGRLFIDWVLPVALLYAFWALFVGRRMAMGMRGQAGAGGGPFGLGGIGRSPAKLYETTDREPVSFADVAGVDDAVDELREVVDFLKQPERYSTLGARVPKGVLLVGPPGTGKTLLARAVAGEAKVAFFSITASEFVEMFVGVGAARVRDLFEQAKQRTPCIIFIDELDAIGRSRGGLGVMATHDEREQTLNQLLAEIDGFDPSRGIVVMAATNRPEILDPALLRAGRFDRRILVDRPDLRGRAAILRVHTRKTMLAPSVDLDVIARRTAGMVGADLANVVNEATLAAARRRSKVVTETDFEEALDRIQLGARKQGRVMTDEDKRRVAIHESGHALVALSVPRSDPVHRVTILPRSSGALGATLQLPAVDRYLLTREELLDRICVLLGGRAAELLLLDDLSTGSADDLQRATELARQMVCRFGMSERMGDVAVEPETSPFLGLPMGNGARSYSEETARLIDEEVRGLLDAERERAWEILRSMRGSLEQVVDRLMTEETLERSTLEALLANSGPRRPASQHHEEAPP